MCPYIFVYPQGNFIFLHNVSYLIYCYITMVIFIPTSIVQHCFLTRCWLVRQMWPFLSFYCLKLAKSFPLIENTTPNYLLDSTDNFLALSVADKGYSRNASCALDLIFTFLMYKPTNHLNRCSIFSFNWKYNPKLFVR
jgi:hypothetical protein